MAKAKRKPTGDYSIGFARPPKHSQFQQGHSGNPGGRPKKSPDYADMLLRIINKRHVGVADGKRKRMSTIELAMTRLANSAANGDRAALADLIKHMDRFGIKSKSSQTEGLVFVFEDAPKGQGDSS
jgi:Family of unknown function (DUF5681)